MFFAGCQQTQQQTQAPNEKQARLLAAQSADLQSQLAACKAEIETLRQEHANELAQRDAELAKCRARIETLRQTIKKGISEQVTGVTTRLIEENAKLQKEIEQLKARIKELELHPNTKRRLISPIRPIRPIGPMGQTGPMPPRRRRLFSPPRRCFGRSASRCCLFIAAATRPTNIGCGRSGREVRQGWAWVPMKNGWSGSSRICMIGWSGALPEKTMPFSSSISMYRGSTS